MRELERRRNAAMSYGLQGSIITPAAAVELCPLLDESAILSAYHVPTDGLCRAVTVCHTLQDWCRQRGVRFWESTKVTGVRIEHGRVQAVETAQGTISCGQVLVAGGLWQIGWLESDNAWDYLVDPIYCLASAANLIGGWLARWPIARRHAGACAASVAADMLHDRAALVARTNAAAAAEMQKLAAAVEQSPETAREHATRVKIAGVVDEFDRANQLQRLYDAGGLPRAEEVLFAITEKAARDFTTENVETTTGNVYALADLEKLAIDQVRAWLGDDFAAAVSAGGVFLDREKLAEIGRAHV